MLATLLKTLKSKSKLSRAQRRGSAKRKNRLGSNLRCESLEDRRMLSASSNEFVILEEVSPGIEIERTVTFEVPGYVSPIAPIQAPQTLLTTTSGSLKFNLETETGSELDQLLNSSDPAEVQLGQNVLNGFIDAADNWSELFTDDVTVNVTIDFPLLGDGILGSASSNREVFSYTDVRNALISDSTSDDDATAVSNMQSGPSLEFVTNARDGSIIALANTADAYTNFLDVTTANAKAIGLIGANNTEEDAAISFSNNFSYDFDSSDGITANHFDFVAIATHEIGHALGFVSGVDTVDVFSGSGLYANVDINGTDPGIGELSEFAIYSTLDTFRYSDVSLAHSNQPTVGGRLNLMFGQYFGDRPYFSIDASTELGTFSEGRFNSLDQQQASHWEPGQNLGLMGPTLGVGVTSSLTELDIQAFDVIGWDLAAPEVTALEISGSNSTHADYLFENGVNVGSGEQLKTVPIGGADTVSITFNTDVNITETDLVLHGLQTATTPALATGGFSYDSTTYTATWEFANNFSADQYLIQLSDNVNANGIALDGEWTNPASVTTVNSGLSTFPSGNGTAGGDFEFVFTILPGDFYRDNIVDFQDVVILSPNFNQITSGATFTDGDANGDGAVDFSDVAVLSGNYYKDMAFLDIATDFNQDYSIDGLDQNILVNNWASTVTPGEDGDANGDGNVDGIDLNKLTNQFGIQLDVLS